jgi:hypothetical protein
MIDLGVKCLSYFLKSGIQAHKYLSLFFLNERLHAISKKKKKKERQIIRKSQK